MTGAADRGAVFVEAMIAAAIVAMALGSTFQVIADGAARDRRIEARRMALLVAQSEMADVGADIPLQVGETTGVSGRYAWRVDVSAYTAEGAANSAGALLKVSVAVRPREGGPLLATISGLRLGGEG
jgi:hypothetical protein